MESIWRGAKDSEVVLRGPACQRQAEFGRPGLHTVRSFELVTEALARHGSKRSSGAGTHWQCPAHDDTNPSLSLRYKDGKVLLNCFAGCSTNAITESIGLDLKDLFDTSIVSEVLRSGPRPTRSNGRKKSESVAEYVYTDRDGEPLSTKTRYEPGSNGRSKSFSWSNGNPGVLYNLKGVIDAEHVHINEGEKAANALSMVLPPNEIATCPPTAVWEPNYTVHLVGKSVTLWTDRDEPGEKRASKVYAQLTTAGIKVTVVQSATTTEKSDAFDHLDVGFGVEDAIRIDPAKLSRKEEGGLEPEAKARQRWPIFWSQDADATASAEYVIDGLIHAGTVGSIFGPSGTLKTMIALDHAAHITQGLPWRGMKTRQGCVVYVAAEGKGGIGRRIAGLHIEHPSIPDNMIATVTRSVQLLDADAVGDFTDQLIEEVLPEMRLPLRMLYFDTYSQSTTGGQENDSSTLALAESNVRTMIERVGEYQCGCAPAGCLIHHSGKDASRGPRGTSAMFDNLDWLIETEFSTSNPKTVAFEDRRYGMTSVKVKDGPDGNYYAFKAGLVEVGIREEDQKIITAPIVREVSKADLGEVKKGGPQWNKMGARSSILHECMAILYKRDRGIPLPPEVKINHSGLYQPGQHCLPESDVRKEFYGHLVKAPDKSDISQDAKRKAFDRALEDLQKRKIVMHFDGYIWDL